MAVEQPNDLVPAMPRAAKVERATATGSEIHTRRRRPHLRALIECADDAILGTLLDGTITSCNSGAERLLGWTAHEMLGRSVDMLIPPEEHERERLSIAQLTRGETLEPFDAVRMTRDGRQIAVSVRLSAARGKSGALVGISRIAREIAPDRLADRKIARSFFDFSTELLCVTDFEGNFVRLNPAWESTFGFSLEDLIAKPCLDFVHPDDRAATLVETKRLTSNDSARRPFENRYRCRDGAYRWLLWNTISIPGERFLYATAVDVTERKLAAAAQLEILADADQVNRELSFHKFALDQHALVTITDPTGRITYVNDRFCEISGFAREELLDQDHRLVNSGRHPRPFFRQLYATIKRGCVWRGEICNRAKDGHVYWVDTTIVPFLDEIGRVTRYVAIRADITERVLAAEEIERVHQQLAGQNRGLAALTEQAHRFVDDVSHEFRTPLAVIKEFGSIIADGLGGEVTAEQQQYLGMIDNAVLDLNQMVEDFADASKLRVGRLHVDRRAHTLDAIFERVRPDLQKKAASRAITLVERIEPDLPRVFADEEKVRRVIMSLATNAVKFAPQHSQLELWARQSRDGGVEVGVTDHGPGLTPADLNQALERFRQPPNSDAASVKGFGLGLNIARLFVWLNLGKMNVTSVVGQGSTFAFTLPADDPQMSLVRFFASLAEFDEGQLDVAVLAVTTTEPAASLEALRVFLAATTRPNDLVLAMRSTSGDGFVLLGPTQSAVGWMSRLLQERERTLAGAGASAHGKLRIKILGTFAYPNGVCNATTCALEHLRQAGPVE
jgi:PAS domain S-box-containing protein